MPTTWIKAGVLGDLTRPTQKCLGRIIRLYYEKGLDFYQTSIREANHQPGSFHYIGDAFDFLQQSILIGEIMKAAGPEFQVIPNDAKGIFHVERDS